MSGTHLGERKETLGDGDDILHLLNRLDAVLDDLGVLGPGRVEDVADTLDVALGPVTVRLADGLEGNAGGVCDDLRTRVRERRHAPCL